MSKRRPLLKEEFNQLQILVIGDAMIDRYIYGEIHRESPEANVPIVNIKHREDRLGGAANVALNLTAIGVKAHLMTFEGNDKDSLQFKQLLKDSNVCFKLVDSNRKTTVKTRIYNEDEYLMRCDEEDTFDINEQELEQLYENVKTACEKVPLNAVIFQDYNKGLFTKRSIDQLINLIRPFKIPIIVDPKKDNFLAYKKVDLFKPNLKELNQAYNLQTNGTDKEGLSKMTNRLIQDLDCHQVLITLSENGALIADKDGLMFDEGYKRKVVDVSGAGDTVIAMASSLFALGFSKEDILFYSNLAGSKVIESRGVSGVSLEDLKD